MKGTPAQHFGRAAQRRCHEVAEDVAERAQENLIRNGSYVTGELLRSVGVRDTRTSAEVTVGADYWAYVEYGTGLYHEPDPHTTWTGAHGETHRGQHAAPFLRPAYEEVRAQRLGRLGGLIPEIPGWRR